MLYDISYLYLSDGPPCMNTLTEYVSDNDNLKGDVEPLDTFVLKMSPQ